MHLGILLSHGCLSPKFFLHQFSISNTFFIESLKPYSCSNLLTILSIFSSSLLQTSTTWTFLYSFNLCFFKVLKANPNLFSFSSFAVWLGNLLSHISLSLKVVLHQFSISNAFFIELLKPYSSSSSLIISTILLCSLSSISSIPSPSYLFKKFVLILFNTLANFFSFSSASLLLLGNLLSHISLSLKVVLHQFSISKTFFIESLKPYCLSNSLIISTILLCSLFSISSISLSWYFLKTDTLKVANALPNLFSSSSCEFVFGKFLSHISLSPKFFLHQFSISKAFFKIGDIFVCWLNISRKSRLIPLISTSSKNSSIKTFIFFPLSSKSSSILHSNIPIALPSSIISLICFCL